MHLQILPQQEDGSKVFGLMMPLSSLWLLQQVFIDSGYQKKYKQTISLAKQQTHCNIT